MKKTIKVTFDLTIEGDDEKIAPWLEKNFENIPQITREILEEEMDPEFTVDNFTADYVPEDVD